MGDLVRNRRTYSGAIAADQIDRPEPAKGREVAPVGEEVQLAMVATARHVNASANFWLHLTSTAIVGLLSGRGHQRTEPRSERASSLRLEYIPAARAVVCNMLALRPTGGEAVPWPFGKSGALV